MPMTDLAAERKDAVAALIEDVRAIAQAGPLDRDAMARIRARLLPLAARKELWGEADYPSPPEGERQNRYLVGQEGPEGISLYLNVLRRGKRIPPHNHTTWACVAAVEGTEHNILYERLDDGAQPGKAEIRERETRAISPGDAIAMLPDDIHSVEIRDDEMIRHLHFYGRPLETLDSRLTFDTETGTCKIMTMPVKTKT
jgi:predicted metal-dependent enzyme (double-stranded beta helix superfamily)